MHLLTDSKNYSKIWWNLRKFLEIGKEIDKLEFLMNPKNSSAFIRNILRMTLRIKLRKILITLVNRLLVSVLAFSTYTISCDPWLRTLLQVWRNSGMFYSRNIGYTNVLVCMGEALKESNIFVKMIISHVVKDISMGWILVLLKIYPWISWLLNINRYLTFLLFGVQFFDMRCQYLSVLKYPCNKWIQRNLPDQLLIDVY